MQDISNKVALITGGSKGIGLGIAEVLLEAGLKVAVTSRSAGVAQATANKLNESYPGMALGIASDVRDLAAEEKAVATTVAHFGQLDVLVANAGLGHFAPIQDLTAEQWHSTYAAVLAELKLTRHRASTDALVVRLTLARIRGDHGAAQ